MLQSNADGCLTKWEKESRFEIVFRRANGATAEDVDGNVYLDLTSCSGASPLGSNDTEFISRLAEEMQEEPDVLPSPVGTQRQKLARRMTELYPDHPRVFFLRTGSCATEAAVRIARYATGRPVILTAGFHGWHDVFQQEPWTDNAPAADVNILDFRYDLQLLERQFAEHEGQVAAIFFTPEPSVFAPEVLKEATELARRNGALVIVDEVLCGLRYASGGYCRAHGISADLISIAKGIAQGTGLSAVVGTDRAMAGADAAYLGNTYLRENRAFVAANITQDIFVERAVLATITTNGERLKTLFQEAFSQRGLSAAVLGKSTMFDIILPTMAHGEAWAQSCLKNGVYIGYPGTYMSNAAMDDAFMDRLSDAVERSLNDYETTVDRSSRVSEASIIDYSREAFRATEGACLRCKSHWKSNWEREYERH